MTSSPTHPSPLFSDPPPPTPPCFFSALPCPRFSDAFPKIFPKISEDFRRGSPPIRSQENLRKIWSEVAHDVSLMSFLSIFLVLRKIDIASDDFQQPIRSQSFGAKFEWTNHKPPFPTVKSGLM